VRAVVNVERGEHNDIAGAHADDVAGVTGSVPAPVEESDRGRREGHSADDEQVVVLPPAHDRQRRGGAEDDGDRAVEPASCSDVARTSLARQCGADAGYHGSQAGDDVHRQEGQEDRRGGAHLVAEDAGGDDHPVDPPEPDV
jgi:hypothetical protein